MARRRPLRGTSLDGELKKLLAEQSRMDEPIAVVRVAEQLGLGSRTPLYVPHRRALIQAAQRAQSKNRSVLSKAKRSKHHLDLIAGLREEKRQLQSTIISIAIALHANGIAPERFMDTERVGSESSLDHAERLASRWLETLSNRRVLGKRGSAS